MKGMTARLKASRFDIFDTCILKAPGKYRVWHILLVLLVSSCVQNSRAVLKEEAILREDTRPASAPIDSPITPESLVYEPFIQYETPVYQDPVLPPETVNGIQLGMIDRLDTPPQETVAFVQPNRTDTSVPELPGIPSIPERPVVPPIPEYIMGQGLTIDESLSNFLRFYNPGTGDFSKELAKLYVEEAFIEGINHDIAFAQMCLETGFLRFGGLVTAEMNNFCGLGAIGPGQRGEWFPDPRTGVRAHIQHLKAYATDVIPTQELVDPRYNLVRYGSSPKISGLAGTWAVDRLYAEKINNILERLYEFAFRR